jgi:hypothetical protein
MSACLRSRERGQSLIEFTLVLPLLIVIAFGVTEVGYALLDQHAVTRITREGANLISRDATLQDAGTAMRQMMTRPVDFDNGSRLIFSVLKRVSTTGSANYGQVVLYQRYEYGTLSASSALTTAGTPAFGPAPDYLAVNSDNNTSLRITNLPENIALVNGGLLYVTEVYSTHELLTPLDRFGITMPDRLYAVAYF